MTSAEWANYLGISIRGFLSRISRGYSDKEIYAPKGALKVGRKPRATF